MVGRQMDWTTFAQIWGPAVPMFLVFVFYIHRLIFKTVPRGFRALRLQMDSMNEDAGKRHDEAMGELRRLEKAMIGRITKYKTAAGKNTRRQNLKKP